MMPARDVCWNCKGSFRRRRPRFVVVDGDRVQTNQPDLCLHCEAACDAAQPEPGADWDGQMPWDW